MHILRDRRTLSVLLLMPLAQILIFGYVISTEIKDARIGVLDKAGDYASEGLRNRLAASGYFKVERIFVNELEVAAALRSGAVQMAVVIGPGFGSASSDPDGSRVQLLADASEANTAQMLVNYAEGIVRDYEQELVGVQARQAALVEVRMAYNPSLKGVFMSVPGIMAMILMLVSAMMTSISITREKEYGSMEILLVSPLKPWQIILRSEEHTSELQSRPHLVCRLLLEKKKTKYHNKRLNTSDLKWYQIPSSVSKLIALFETSFLASRDSSNSSLTHHYNVPTCPTRFLS